MKLYYAQGACSLAPHLILEELGGPYETREISFEGGDLDRAEFKKLNPMGAVPVLQLDNGQVLTENVAILSYLADSNPSKRLIPPAGSFERTRAIEWLSFLATEVHKPFGMLFSVDRAFKNAVTIEEVKARGHDLATTALDVVEAKLPSNGYALGTDYSVVDAYLYVFFYWARYLKFDLNRWPKYGSLISRITERPATLRILKAEDLLD